MTRCEQLYENFEQNLDLLRKCVKDKSIIGRVARYVQFRQTFNLPKTFYAYAPEGLVRDIVAKWHKNEDVSIEVEATRKVLEEEQQICKVEIERASRTVEALEHLQKIKGKLPKSDKKTLDKARKIVKIQTVPDVRKTMRKKMKATIKEFTKPKTVPNGIETVTLHLNKQDYETIEKHFCEGKKAKTKKELASRIAGFVLRAITELQLRK